MAIYQYEAFTASGERVQGLIEAPSPQAATAKLRQQALFVKNIRQDSAKRDRELFPFLSKIFQRIGRKDIGIFAKQLGTLLGAGIPLHEALNDILEQTENQALKKVLSQMKQDVTEGRSLSQALAEHKDVFPPVYENMVRVGEVTGSYEPTLNRLAELEEKNEELKSKAITALIYPGIMLSVSVFVVLFLLTSVVPQIKMLFESYQGELPLPTRFVIFMSELMQNFWYVLILLSAGGFYAYQKYKATEPGKRKIDRFWLKVPFFGSLFVKIQVGRFCRNLGVLTENHVPLLTGLEIVSGTVTNSIFADELRRAAKMIREGSSMKDALKTSEILPQMAKGMISAGESTDRLSELLIKAAQILESEIDSSVRRMTNSLEPIMIVVLGGIVALIMASVMLPLYRMTELIK